MVDRLIADYGLNLENSLDFSNKKIKSFRSFSKRRIESFVGFTQKGMVTGIRLCNNSIESLEDIAKFVDSVLSSTQTLQWIDFSNNFISTLNREFLCFPKLQFLVFEHNHIHSFDEIKKLQHIKTLRALVFLDNPVTAQRGYRDFIYYQFPMLNSLDYQWIRKASPSMSSVDTTDTTDTADTTDTYSTLSQELLTEEVNSLNESPSFASSHRDSSVVDLLVPRFSNPDTESIALSIDSSASKKQVRISSDLPSSNSSSADSMPKNKKTSKHVEIKEVEGILKKKDSS